MPPRLRMVAGPNGSGKTTLIGQLSQAHAFPLGFVLNADEVEKTLVETGRFAFDPWNVTVDEATLAEFLRTHPLAASLPLDSLSVNENTLSIRGDLGRGYLAAVLCDFIRRHWVNKGTSFTFETVMSSRDKVELLSAARSSGYRTYLYYVCTNDPSINRERVSMRVSRGGHDVPKDKIESRYSRSLALLGEAIRNSDRAFLFDNSGTPRHRFIAEYESGSLAAIVEDVPEWVKRWAPLPS
jgi:predicted ABC-type ATPase